VALVHQVTLGKMMGKELKEEYPTLFLVSQYTDHAILAHLPQGEVCTIVAISGIAGTVAA
jgi:hypothetical protein